MMPRSVLRWVRGCATLSSIWEEGEKSYSYLVNARRRDVLVIGIVIVKDCPGIAKIEIELTEPMNFNQLIKQLTQLTHHQRHQWQSP